ncbi:MAG: flagellar hook-length control protein FliK [Desulfobulbaceae bacterium]|nr:flagellar hook-length control protein FliK [Desulfobulbaceae bacterium]
MPTIQVDPTSAGVPAEAKSTAAPAADGQFSQHLETAGRNIAPTSGKGKTGHPVAAEDMHSTSVEDQENDIGEELENIVAGDIQLIMATLQNQTTELPKLTGKGLNTTGNPQSTQQDAQLKSLLDSIQIQGISSQGQNNEKPATTLASLLEKTIASGNEKQISVGNDKATTLAKPSSGQTTPAITIENWRAQFSYQSRTGIQDANIQKPVPAQMQTPGEGGLREPVLAYVSPEVEKVAAPAQAKHGSGIDFPSQPRDANSNYIHSNLPGVNVKTQSESSNKNAQQQNGEGQKNMAKDAIAQAEHAAAKSSQDTPLIFTLDQERASGLLPQGQTNSTSLMLKLPSGTEVPHSQIINQVIDRFTLNRTLESGNITLKLHPAELGELRMEIRVEQDNIKAHITTQNPLVQDILDRHLPRLREALEQQGLNLEQMTVTVGTDDGSNSQLFQEHFGSRQSGRSPQSNNERLAFSLDQEPLNKEEIVDGQQTLSVLI